MSMFGGKKRLMLYLLQRYAIDKNGCWVWLQQRKLGYGAMSVRPYGGFQAHRVSYTAYKGKIPKGLFIDHLCRNRYCINPDHLEPVTHEENIRRSPIVPSSINAAKTHCIRGHEFTPENTYVYRLPNRIDRHCKACDRYRKALKQK